MYERIKELCALKGISIQALEKEASLSNGAISKWTISTPKADALYRVAIILGTTSDYLLTGEIEKSPAPKEGEADAKRDELIRILSVLDPSEREQLLAHGRTLVIAHEAKGTDPKSP